MKRDSAHQRLLLLQKRIYRSLQAEAEHLLGETPPAIRRYERKFRRDFLRLPARITGVKKSELIRKIREADVTFIADFHTFGQAQRTALRLIREAVRPGENWLIGLELIPSQFQNALDAFQAGRIPLETFHEAISYNDEWGFSWENYEPLFTWAREKGVRLIALNRPKALNGAEGGSELYERDRWTAGIITDQFHALRGAGQRLRFIALYGELHLASAHLPHELKTVSASFLKTRLRTLTVHQNNDEIYWQLAAKGRELATEIVRLRADAYCVLSSTPWARLQSLVNWAEGDVPHIEDHEPTDYLSLIRTYGDTFAEFLGLAPPSYSGLTVQTIREADFVEALAGTGALTAEELELVRFHVTNNLRLYIPSPQIAYLGSPSQNAAAEVAAIHTLRTYTKAGEGFFKRQPEEFYRFVLESAFGFLGSLLLNPRRKCDLPADHQRRLRALSGSGSRSRPAFKQEREARKLTVAVLKADGSRAPLLSRYLASRARGPATLVAAQWVGQILGKRLHRGIFDETLRVEGVRRLFVSRSRTDESWSDRYYELLARLSPAPSAPSKSESL